MRPVFSSAWKVCSVPDTQEGIRLGPIYLSRSFYQQRNINMRLNQELTNYTPLFLAGLMVHSHAIINSGGTAFLQHCAYFGSKIPSSWSTILSSHLHWPPGACLELFSLLTLCPNVQSKNISVTPNHCNSSTMNVN